MRAFGIIDYYQIYVIGKFLLNKIISMKKLFLVCVLIGLLNSTIAQNVDLPSYANAFLYSLDSKLKVKAQYAYDDKERFNWHYVPRQRNGVAIHDLNEKQKDAAFALLKAFLSDQGFQKTTGILSLEAVLRGVEGRDADDSYRDPSNYYFTIFGTPSSDKPWGWRLEGHHISLNFSSVDGSIVSGTPSFFGANPAVIPSGKDKGKQILELETELGFALVNSLTPTQLKVAKFSETALFDIASGSQKKAETLEPAGIAFIALNENQKKQFLQLLDVYVQNYQLGFSHKLMDKIKKAGFDKLSFAWAGSLKPGAGHYYRIQGPMLLIEYDNTQNGANHVHSVVRDLTNDFAEDILKEHYAREHK